MWPDMTALGDPVIFTPQNNSLSTGGAVWTKPRQCSWVYILFIGAGAGGGSGASVAAAASSGGGGGGSSGAVSSILMPAQFVPDGLVFSMGFGGAGAVGGAPPVDGSAGSVGGASRIISLNTNVTLFPSGGSSAGQGGTSAAGGTAVGGSAPNNTVWLTQGIAAHLAPVSGGAGGFGAAGSTNFTSGPVMGGTGGGGCTAGSGFNGGATASPLGFPAIAGIGGGTTGFASEVVGRYLWSMRPLIAPGSTGGQSLAGGAQAFGGTQGWYGCGGGGGGASSNSRQAGNGGNGGDGIAFVWSW